MSDETKKQLDSIARKLAEAALEIRAIKLQPHDPFQWASGYRMPIYNDNRQLLGTAAHRALVADGLVQLLKLYSFDPEVIAGTATAGIPHATTLADRLQKPLIYIRDRPKDHGLGNRIEGVLHQGQTVLVVEDLISTGGSSLTAAVGTREAGGKVPHCFSIFDYGFPEAQALFRENDIQLSSLLTFPILLEIARKRSYITDKDEPLLLEWQQDPFGWGEKHGFPRVIKGDAGKK